MSKAQAAAEPERRDFRHTKIVCTLGPQSSSSEMMERMARAGMNIARLNMSHGDRADHDLAIRRLKNLRPKLNHPISILLDLQGPEIRTGELKRSVNLKVGETFTFTVMPVEDPEERSVHVDYKDFVEHLKPGDHVTVDNGLINLEVLEATEEGLRCRVLHGGMLGSRRHINLPGVRVKLPSITDKDRADIEFGLARDVDFLALSFVRAADDVREAQRMIADAGSHTRVIAKIENREGIDNLEEILEVADGIMIARGDLGVEIDFHELPVIQRDIIRRCAVAGKPVIVATHLVESMIENPIPTRAEVTDVANAVYEQADAIMLSGETATGRHPVRCVEVLDKIARRIEKQPGLEFHRERQPADVREELARSACRLADSMGAPAIAVITRRGLLGQLVASYRPAHAIVYAFTNMSSTRRKLWLLRSVVPFVVDFSRDPERTVQTALARLRKHNRVLPGDRIVVVSDIATAADEMVTTIQVRSLRTP